ncbi:glycosyltransferase family 4 protein [Kaustia mangrovi]|uniref:Glycosyltransferase family 4 protein n=1 Tax=Kaustia mangrovi TaxID=2593653 RepID=A0A7S8C1E3_9HYPH|nr:glycosyltransferase family 4 protein [Kaustia mangrovi]QPC41512.1 glycosyltransferase family 4 protein [Kaustia mangrovi]
MSTRILVVAHNHPDFHPGGTEIFAHDLFGAYKRAGAEALFVGATNRIHREPRPGTSFQAVGDAGDEVVLWAGHFDRFMMSQTDLYGVIQDLKELLCEFRPDIVHIHHMLLVGAEFPALVRRILPDALIVMTLHDYYPICAHDGLMVKTGAYERCGKADPSRCNGCFPDIAPDRFLLRELNIKTHMRAVDRFISPSQFLKDRYVGWGIDEDRISVVRNGRPAAHPVPARKSADGQRNVFGYFGNLNPWKGAPVLLKACRYLMEAEIDFELRIHGGAPFQSENFTDELEALLKDTEGCVTWHGAYGRGDVAALMAGVDWAVLPSIWWENAPLVIQEAQLHGRPMIVSGIGGMAEMVTDEETGLHVRPNDPFDLARIMRRCILEDRLWDRLARNIAPPPDIDDVAAAHLELFGDLREAAAAETAA